MSGTGGTACCVTAKDLDCLNPCAMGFGWHGAECETSFWRTQGVDVLKIIVTETETDRRWIVQGRLVGPWVSELRTAWKRAHRSQDKRACIIDLNDVTFIDKSGERLLRAMSKKGAQLMANGLYVKHVLEQVKNSCMPSADRIRRNSSTDSTPRTEDK